MHTLFQTPILVKSEEGKGETSSPALHPQPHSGQKGGSKL